MQMNNPKSIEDAFGREVRAQRARLRMSQKALSEMLAERGVKLDPSAITRIEKEGQRSIRLSEAVAIASVLAIDLERLSYDFADPKTQIETHRTMADESMRIAYNSLMKMLNSLAVVDELVHHHPELMAGLASENRVAPSDPDSYLQWVSENISDFGSGGVVVDNERLSLGLGKVAHALVQQSISLASAETIDEDGSPSNPN